MNTIEHKLGQITYTVEVRKDYWTKMYQVSLELQDKKISFLSVNKPQESNIIIAAEALFIKKVGRAS